MTIWLSFNPRIRDRDLFRNVKNKILWFFNFIFAKNFKGYIENNIKSIISVVSKRQQKLLFYVLNLIELHQYFSEVFKL